jgi:hypothetical protein
MAGGRWREDAPLKGKPETGYLAGVHARSINPGFRSPFEIFRLFYSVIDSVIGVSIQPSMLSFTQSSTQLFFLLY